jgi:hypothetical protein
MAKVTDAPAEHRRHANSVPADILNRLSADELRVRCAHMFDLHQAADTAPAFHARYLVAHARKVGRSMPVVHYITEKARLSRLAASADRQIHWGPDGPWSLAGSYEGVRRELADEHAYPDGLEAAVDAAMLGRTSTPEAVAIVTHHRSS